MVRYLFISWLVLTAVRKEPDPTRGGQSLGRSVSDKNKTACSTIITRFASGNKNVSHDIKNCFILQRNSKKTGKWPVALYLMGVGKPETG
jgi:hypothetical protein